MRRNSASIIVSPDDMLRRNPFRNGLLGAPSKEFVIEHKNNYFLVPATEAIPATQRLIFLVPEGDLEANEFVHLLTSFSAQMAIPILLVGVCGRSRQSRENVYWKVARLESLLAAKEVRTNSLIIEQDELLNDWANLFQAGDLCLCFEEHQILRNGWIPSSLVALISQKKRIPIYVITGFKEKIFHPAKRLMKESAGWVLALALMGANSFLIANVYQHTAGLNQIALAVLATIATLAGLLLINNWMG